ncbi:MAG: sulfatase-like hydrolase/transferase, partial [Oscillospiraceae bacterium]
MKKQPNIVFFFVDQQRWDTAGCYGQPLDITPNLDRMAEEGTLFQNAYTCQPVCGPARACLQTGRYAT